MIAEQKYCLYVKDGKAISEVMECSHKNNISVQGIMIVRSTDPEMLRKMMQKNFISERKKITPEVVRLMQEHIRNEDFDVLHGLIFEYTGKDLCCGAKMISLVDALSNQLADV